MSGVILLGAGGCQFFLAGQLVERPKTQTTAPALPLPPTAGIALKSKGRTENRSYSEPHGIVQPRQPGGLDADYSTSALVGETITMASNDSGYQSKEGYYPPQHTKGNFDYSTGALNAGKGEDYEILEAGQRFNDDASAGLAEGPWASGADVEKQLRLGEFCLDPEN